MIEVSMITEDMFKSRIQRYTDDPRVLINVDVLIAETAVGKGTTESGIIGTRQKIVNKWKKED